MTDPHPSPPPSQPSPETDGFAPAGQGEAPSVNGETPQDLEQIWLDSVAQLEILWREIPHQSQRLWQQTQASLQLRWGGQAQLLRDQLTSSLAASRITNSLDPLRQTLSEVIQQLSPSQMEVLLEAIPTASDRALLASLYVQILDEYSAGMSLEVQHREAAARAYGLSGLPMVIGSEGQVQVEASAALTSAIVSIQIAGATAATALSFLGTPELKRLLKADQQLRSKALSESRKLLPPEENWQLLKQLLYPADSDSADPIWDAPLALTQLGIEGAQLAEFVGEQIKTILNLGLLRAFTPPILMEALQLLTSDLLFAVGISVESALESTGAARRVELVLAALPKAQRIPTPEQIRLYTPEVLAETDQKLRPLIARQALEAANGLDPQMRNATLNQIGQNLNLWNPFQFFAGWQGRDWLSSVLQRLQELEVNYPSLPSLQTYTSGLEEALQVYRVMEQAQTLRSVARRLDPEMAEAL